ncbi:similar to Saccharomyces cerevisiae YFL027C GYP8 GTPase-activating protein for yeast Rab family members [Maudiozyma saulgeensis]|uniref:Similar to Saccharomyces cerevisiae YFL027C GYP8 GTPase-activating protein for yeast Rab family members n=1 Tax=Maudiozyma saulgeensis TaxID=1789683 RepID=A0A1X7QYQ1_9SACH|nr:similar to Saccharomyces cerevisiae YFL027C GYP8 GTPase-activating protein for yeast Rab family members [Kazachstania saulgeensis]
MTSIIGLGTSEWSNKLIGSDTATDDCLSFLPSFYNDKTIKELKWKVINHALISDDVPLLYDLGKSKCGFVSNEIRQRSWHKVLTSQLALQPRTNTDDLNVPHCDENQIELDVNRSFGYISNEEIRISMKKILKEEIVHFFRSYPKLRYYQGYHDVVSTFLVVFCYDSKHKSIKTKLSHQIKRRLSECIQIYSLLYLRDFLMDSLDFPIDQIDIIPFLIKSKDITLYQKLQLDKIKPFFAIASILTIFSHDLKPDISDDNCIIFQIFDLVICTHSMYTPLIIYSNMILAVKSNLYEEYDKNLENFENETDLVHGIIQKVLIQSMQDNTISTKLWANVLTTTRTSYMIAKETQKKIYKMINKASPLRNTGSGMQLVRIIDQNYIGKLIDKGISLNKENHKSSSGNDLFEEWKYSKLIKASLVIGVCSLALGACDHKMQLSSHVFSTPNFDTIKFTDVAGLLSESFKDIKNII